MKCCSVVGCNKSYWAKNLCKIHYLRSYRVLNSEKIKTHNKAKYWEHCDEMVAYNHSYYKANSTAIREQTAEYYQHNADRMKECARQYRLANPAKTREYDSRKQALLYNAQGSHTYQEVLDLLNKQRGYCAACRKKLDDKYQEDHIIALSRGGTNDVKNIQLLCAPCNNKKRAKDPIQFMQERGFLL